MPLIKYSKPEVNFTDIPITSTSLTSGYGKFMDRYLEDPTFYIRQIEVDNKVSSASISIES